MDLRFEREISNGAFGTVWLAEDLRITRKYAVKFFDRTNPAFAEFEAHAQASIMSRIGSKHVVRLFAIEEQVNPRTLVAETALIMEYIEGVCLEHSLENYSRERAAGIVSDLINGLSDIHAVGLTHRDLSGRNVIVTNAGAKIIDLYDRGTASKAFLPPNVREDVRDLAGLIRQVLENTISIDSRELHDAYYHASTQCESTVQLAGAFARVLPELGTAVSFFARGRLGGIGTPGDWHVTGLRFAADGLAVAIAAQHSTDEQHELFMGIKPWNDLARVTVGSGSRRIEKLDWSASASVLAASCYDAYVVIDATVPRELLRRDLFCIYGQIAVSPCGGFVAVASVFGSAELVTTRGDRVLSAWLHNPAASYGIHFEWSPRAAQLAVHNEASGVEVWGTDRSVVHRLGKAEHFQWWPDASRYGVVQDGRLLVFSHAFALGDGPETSDSVAGVAASTETFATSSTTGLVEVWRPQTTSWGAERYVQNGRYQASERLTKMAYSSDARLLAVMSGSSIALLEIDGPNCKLVAEERLDTLNIEVMGWDHDSLLFRRSDTVVGRLSARGCTVQEFDEPVLRLDCLPDGELALSIGRRICLVRIGTSPRFYTLRVDGTTAALAPDS